MNSDIKFELNEYHKNISQDDLLLDLKRVADILNRSYLSISDYEKNGKYSANPFISNFGSWLNACELAGLRIIRDKIDFQRITDDDLLYDMRSVSDLLNSKSISTKNYKDYGKYSVQTILTRFKTWSTALEKANLEQTNFKTISDRDLFNEIERVWILKGKQPTTTDIKNGLFNYSLNTYCRRFGSWRSALEAFVEYIYSNCVDEKSEDRIQDDFENKKSCMNDSCDSTKTNEKCKKGHRTSRNINARLRFKIMNRDNFKCCACGASPAKDPSVELHVDHIIPWSKGGETVEDNLQTLCSKCNLGKSDCF